MVTHETLNSHLPPPPHPGEAEKQPHPKLQQGGISWTEPSLRRKGVCLCPTSGAPTLGPAPVRWGPQNIPTLKPVGPGSAVGIWDTPVEELEPQRLILETRAKAAVWEVTGLYMKEIQLLVLKLQPEARGISQGYPLGRERCWETPFCILPLPRGTEGASQTRLPESWGCGPPHVLLHHYRCACPALFPNPGSPQGTPRLTDDQRGWCSWALQDRGNQKVILTF